MSIVMKIHKGNRTGLVVICDKCGKIIKDAALANIAWCWSDCQKEGDTCSFKILCKECDSPTTNRENQWQDLDTAFIYLLHNSNVDMKQARKKAKTLSEL